MIEAPTRSEWVPLAHLALACLMFDSVTGYNKSLDELFKTTEGRLTLSKSTHRDALLKWLNEWGCRHLSRDQHHVASASILAWHQENRETIEAISAPLWLSDGEIAAAVTAYGSLKDRLGARPKRNEKELQTTIGPTAASKVLFALKPASLPPWDVAMRKHFSCDGSAESYQKFLETVGGMALNVSAQCERNGFPISRLPIELGRPNSSVVSLLNEYLWVTISAGARLPHRFTLARWAEW